MGTATTSPFKPSTKNAYKCVECMEKVKKSLGMWKNFKPISSFIVLITNGYDVVQRRTRQQHHSKYEGA